MFARSRGGMMAWTSSPAPVPFVSAILANTYEQKSTAMLPSLHPSLHHCRYLGCLNFSPLAIYRVEQNNGAMLGALMSVMTNLCERHDAKGNRCGKSFGGLRFLPFNKQTNHRKFAPSSVLRQID